MELVQMVGTALALGAAAGLKDTAAQTVKDAYAALRDYLQREVPAVASSIQQLEKDPTSTPRRAVVEEDLAREGADRLAELAVRVKGLLECIEKHAPAEIERIGVDLAQLKAAAVRIADVEAAATGVRIREADVAGNVDISGVRAGVSGAYDPNG